MLVKKFKEPHSLEHQHLLSTEARYNLVYISGIDEFNVIYTIRAEAKRKAEEEKALAKALEQERNKKHRWLRKRKQVTKPEQVQKPCASKSIASQIINCALQGDDFAMRKLNKLLTMSEIVSEDDSELMLEVSPSEFENFVVTCKKTPDLMMIFERKKKHKKFVIFSVDRENKLSIETVEHEPGVLTS